MTNSRSCGFLAPWYSSGPVGLASSITPTTCATKALAWAQIPELTSALRDKGATDTEIGYRYRDNPENARRFRDWFSYVKQDNILFFFLLNTLVTLLFIFGALVVFHGKIDPPSQDEIIWDLSQMLSTTMGTFGHYLFLVIALCAMFSTQLAVSDGGYRVWTDMLRTNFTFPRRFTSGQCYLALALTLASIGTCSTWYFETRDVGVLDFFFINAVLNGFGMAVWVPLMLYVNVKFLPKSARPHPVNIVMVSLAGLLYVSFAAYTCWEKVASLSLFN